MIIAEGVHGGWMVAQFQFLLYSNLLKAHRRCIWSDWTLLESVNDVHFIILEYRFKKIVLFYIFFVLQSNKFYIGSKCALIDEQTGDVNGRM